MNTSADTLQSALYEAGHIVIRMKSGLEVRFPIVENRRLRGATPQQLNHIEVSPLGLHWPDLDEDLSLRGLLEGDFGQHLQTSASK